jgi:hypothetical protein
LEKNRRKKKKRERRTTNTTHPGLLRLLSYAEIVLAGPVHGQCGRKRFLDEGMGGKRDLNSGLGPVLKYWLTTAINNPIQINRKFNSIPRTRPHHFHYPGSSRPCAFPVPSLPRSHSRSAGTSHPADLFPLSSPPHAFRQCGHSSSKRSSLSFHFALFATNPPKGQFHSVARFHSFADGEIGETPVLAFTRAIHFLL